MHRRSVQRVGPADHPQEAGRLLEGLGSQTLHLFQGVAAIEGTVGVPMGDDIARQNRPQTGHPGQQRRRGRVEIDADAVHAVFDHRIQRTPQLVLVDIMLVLADTDGLGIDLDQFGEGILQAPGDRDGAANRHVQIGKLWSPPIPTPSKPMRRPPIPTLWSN